MPAPNLTVMRVLLAAALTLAGSDQLAAVEFSAEATALPFPRDARNLEFVAWARDINYTSQSPLKSLAAFYLTEMASRGWEHDESAAEIKEDSIKLMFKHDAVEVEVDLNEWSKEVRVSLDCEKMKFTGVDDPARLAAAGIPVPRATVQLQKDFPLPPGAVNLRYTGEGCTLKSPLKLPEAFEHFTRLASGQGFRESRRPIVTETRRYTELKKGTAQFSVNVFTDPVGSRIVLEYKDQAKEPPVPPLAAVATLPLKGGRSDKTPASAATPASVAATPINATSLSINPTSNKGSAIVSYEGRQYTFANVASFQTKSRGTGATMVVFSSKPIPYNKMQSLIAANNDFSFGDLYEFSVPERLMLQLGDHLSFTFALSSLTIGNSVENGVNEMKIEDNRVRGTLKMPPQEFFKGEPLSFTATVDAAIITPTTRFAGPGN